MKWAYEVYDPTSPRPVEYPYPRYDTPAEAEAERERMYGTGGRIRRVSVRERVVMTYHDGEVEIDLCAYCAWLRDYDYDDDMRVVCGEHYAQCHDCDADDEEEEEDDDDDEEDEDDDEEEEEEEEDDDGGAR